MTQTFKLKKGEISFEREKIIISDDARRQRQMMLLSSSMWSIYGLFSVLRYLKTGDKFLLWTGLFIGIGHFVLLIIFLVRTSKEEILIDEIRSLKTGKKNKNDFLDIRLKNNRLRRITRIENIDELDSYIKTNLKLN